MTAEEAMDRIGNVMESFYLGNITTTEALNQIAQIRGAYLVDSQP